MVRNQIGNLKRELIKRVVQMKNYQLNDSILICSEPRSGSTWLAEILGKLLSSPVCWEPLHFEKGIVSKELNLGWVPFLSEEEKHPEFKKNFEDGLSFKKSNNWTLSTCRLSQLSGQYAITKCVRANLLLPWITKNFQLKRPPIHLLRHPVPTCLSWIKIFDQENWEASGIPSWRNNDRFKNENEFIQSLDGRLLKQIAYWCINNKTTLDVENPTWKSYYYEDLLSKPTPSLQGILKDLSIDFNENDLLKLNTNKASKSNYQKDLIADPTIQLNKWMDDFTPVQLTEIQEIFNHFGVTIYSAFDPLPKR